MKRKYGPDPLPLVERFFDKVKVGKKCWIWKGTVHHSGRAVFAAGKPPKSHIAARIAFELAYGSFEKGLYVCHKCDNKLCVRPTHLFLGTAKDNAFDMQMKGRARPPRGESHPMAKLSDTKISQIRKLIDKRMEQRKIARMYNISPALVCLIKQKKIWKHI